MELCFLSTSLTVFPIFLSFTIYQSQLLYISFYLRAFAIAVPQLKCSFSSTDGIYISAHSQPFGEVINCLSYTTKPSQRLPFQTCYIFLLPEICIVHIYLFFSQLRRCKFYCKKILQSSSNLYLHHVEILTVIMIFSMCLSCV